MTTREAESNEDKDFVEYLFTASTHDYLMFFTNAGRVYVERVHEIPDMGRAAKGRSIANLLELKADEKVAAMIRILSKTNDQRRGYDVVSGRRIIFYHPPRHCQKNFTERILQCAQRGHHCHRHRIRRYAD